MFGIFIFSADGKWYEAGHPFRKKTQEVLSLDDGLIVQLSKDHVNMAAHALHWIDNMDSKTFEECFVYFKEKLPSDIDISEVKKSKKGYVDGNKNYYIRFIVNDKKWFEENLEKL